MSFPYHIRYPLLAGGKNRVGHPCKIVHSKFGRQTVEFEDGCRFVVTQPFLRRRPDVPVTPPQA